MTHIEYRLATTRRRDMVREAAAHRRAGEATDSSRRRARAAGLLGATVHRLSRVAAVRTAP